MVNLMARMTWLLSSLRMTTTQWGDRLNCEGESFSAIIVVAVDVEVR